MAEYKRRSDTASWNAGEVRRAQEEAPRKKKRRRRRRMNPILYILLVLLCSALLAGVGWLLMSDLCAFNRGGIVEKTVEIKADDDMGDVAAKLKEQGLINYEWFFKMFANVTNADEKIGIGTYTLNTDMDYRALIQGMRSTSGNMKAETVKVTIPEGYTVEQIIKLLAKNGVASETDLMETAKTADFNYSFIDNDSEDISRLEGYLFPNTYDFYENDDPERVLEKMLDAFDQSFTNVMKNNLATLNDRMEELMRKNGVFNVSVLTESTPFDVFKQFGFQSGRNVDKFAGATYPTTENGLYYLPKNTNAVLSGKVVDAYDYGTHTLFVAEVTAAKKLSDEKSVTYEYYQSNIKPKPAAPKAEENKSGKHRWVCKICGYVYEGDELPADYVCPLCKHPAEDFEQVE